MKWVKTKEREIVMAVKIEPNFPQCSASNSNGVVLHPLSRRVSLYKLLQRMVLLLIGVPMQILRETWKK